MKKLVILSLGVLLIAAACNKSDDQTNNTTPPPAATPPATTPPTTTPPVTPPATSTDTTITYTSSGFSPSPVTIKKGTKVTFVNNSSANFQPASGPHPAHTNYPEFDPKRAVAAGSSWTFTFDKVGTWPYHDHLNPTRFGQIIVTE
jgi:plastocyanin